MATRVENRLRKKPTVINPLEEKEKNLKSFLAFRQNLKDTDRKFKQDLKKEEAKRRKIRLLNRIRKI